MEYLIIKIIFFSSFFILFYIYLGYPACVFLLSLIRPRAIKKGFFQPSVTILIAAYNEEKVIEATIKNKLELEYPTEKLEIVVISDGSDDRTDDIVRRYTNENGITGPIVRLLRQEPRAGKTSALNMAVPLAKGEILVFSDANSIYDQSALKKLLQNFNDPEVGYVTGKMIYTNPDGSIIGDGCSTYMKYENFLRSMESRIGSIVGVDGGIDATRKALYEPMKHDQLPDFVLPLHVVYKGYRVVYESTALLKESTLKSSKDEYRMRVRVSLRALWALFDMKHLLNIRKHNLFSFELISHKVMRYMAFLFLLMLYASNLYLVKYSSLFLFFFFLQTVLYVLALIAYVLDGKYRLGKILYLPYYFTLVNLAAAHAFWEFISGRKIVTWTPRVG